MNNWMTSDNDNNDDGGCDGGDGTGHWDPKRAYINNAPNVYKIKT